MVLQIYYSRVAIVHYTSKLEVNGLISRLIESTEGVSTTPLPIAYEFHKQIKSKEG